MISRWEESCTFGRCVEKQNPAKTLLLFADALGPEFNLNGLWDMDGVSINRGPQISPQNTTILILRIPTKGPDFWKPPHGNALDSLYLLSPLWALMVAFDSL